MTALLRFLAVMVILIALTAAGCGGGGSAPRPRREVILSSGAVDEKVGKEAAEDVTTDLGIVDDPDLTAYVDAVGQRVARFAPRGRFQYRFAIIDEDVPNAFALPGGYIYVSRGLLILTNSEDELANVLGHEIVHVAARHAAARQAVILGLPGPIKFFAQGHIAGYSRDQEREADRLGQGLAGLAGYDPDGMATFLKNLEFTERLRLGTSRMPGFFDTHPATTQRVADAGGRARIVAWQRTPGIAGSRADFLRRLEGTVVGMGAAEGIFEEQRFIHPDLDFMLRFPDGWTTMNTHVAVGAVSHLRDAQIVLEGQAPAADPETAASDFLAQERNQGIKISRAAPLMIGGLPAYRVDLNAPTPYGWLPLQITWVVRDDSSVFRFTAVAAPGVFARYETTFGAVVRSFRPLTPQLRNAVRENRLQIAQARNGESLAALSERTRNEWNLQMTAVINDVFADAQLADGQLLKVAVSTPYLGDHATP
jgi:predicted Zn-dependent protease